MTRLERDSFRQAGEYLAQAIALEPDYAAAHAWYAYWHIFLVGQDWAVDPDETMLRGAEFAERAVVLDPFDARALTIAGHVRAFLHHSLREAAGLHERALELNPNLAMAWALSAITYAYLGDADEAERRNNRYKALSPLDPHAFFFDVVFGIVHLLRHDYEAAAMAGRAFTQLNPSFSGGYKPYLAALGLSGPRSGGSERAAPAADDRTGFLDRAVPRQDADGADPGTQSLRGRTASRRRGLTGGRWPTPDRRRHRRPKWKRFGQEPLRPRAVGSVDRAARARISFCRGPPRRPRAACGLPPRTCRAAARSSRSAGRRCRKNHPSPPEKIAAVPAPVRNC